MKSLKDYMLDIACSKPSDDNKLTLDGMDTSLFDEEGVFLMFKYKVMEIMNPLWEDLTRRCKSKEDLAFINYLNVSRFVKI